MKKNQTAKGRCKERRAIFRAPFLIIYYFAEESCPPLFQIVWSKGGQGLKVFAENWMWREKSGKYGRALGWINIG